MCYLSQKASLVRVISGDVMTKVFDLGGVVAPGRICIKELGTSIWSGSVVTRGGQGTVAVGPHEESNVGSMTT
jgi:hypothetical protein